MPLLQPPAESRQLASCTAALGCGGCGSELRSAAGGRTSRQKFEVVSSPHRLPCDFNGAVCRVSGGLAEDYLLRLLIRHKHLRSPCPLHQGVSCQLRAWNGNADVATSAERRGVIGVDEDDTPGTVFRKEARVVW